MAENKGKLVQRSEIDEKFKWKTEDIYPDLEAWEADFQRVKEMIPDLKAYAGKLGESAETVYNCFSMQDKLAEKIHRLFAYAARKKDEDTRVSENQSLYNRVISLGTDVSSATSYIVPELLSIPKEKLDEYLAQHQELALYQHYLNDLNRSREHIRSAEIEEVLAMSTEAVNAPYQIYNMLDDADITYPKVLDEEGNKVELTKGRYYKFMQNKDRRVRKDALEAFYVPYEKHTNTLAATFSANIKSSIFQSRVRKYHSTLEAALDDDNISTDVYNNLIDTVSNHLDPMYKYMQLRKKLLGIDDLHMYDVYVSMIKEVDIEIPYEEAKETIIEAVAPLGKEYQQLMRKGLESRWVDVYENAGKASGAYSSGIYGVHPFVLMNYNNTLDSMYTLAHEMGHALHSYFSSQAQPYIYHRYKIFLAEVASTLNEILLMEHLMKTREDKGFKLAILNHFLEQFRGTVYRQTMFAEFEKMAHEKAEAGISLTHDLLSQIYMELNKKYYGPEMNIDPQIALEWSRIPHFYMGFYVYKYATGFSAATTLARKILDEGQPAVDKYLEFLKAGNSDYPINILKKAGVDMSSPEPIARALETFKKTIDEIEKLTAE